MQHDIDKQIFGVVLYKYHFQATKPCRKIACCERMVIGDHLLVHENKG